MELRKIAAGLGINTYPDAFDEIYKEAVCDTEPACNLAQIDRLEAQYGIFGEFYDIVRNTAEQINQDLELSLWVRVTSRYSMESSAEQAFAVPEPVLDGTPIKDLLLLYVLLPQVPSSIERYQAKGFGAEVIQDILGVYQLSLGILRDRMGRPCVDKAYYNWMILFTKVLIFKTEGFQFELNKLPESAIWLRNRKSGQLVPVMLTGMFDAGGVQRIGSLGYTDETGAFSPVFSEDTENYYGHGVFDNIVDTRIRTFSKEEWVCVARPEDNCLCIHIPRGADITRESTLRACRSAMRIAREQFPEHTCCLVFCNSWLLNPTLKQIQGPESRITQFEECFAKYPNRDPAGKAVFGFVFGKPYGDPAQLPENTSLQRKLKKLYMDGGCLHSYSGAIYVKEQPL